MTVMSASTERKNRQAAREAGTDKKQLAQEKAAQEQARSKRRWTIGTIAVVVVIALVLLLNSPLVYKSAAYTVGDRKYSTAEVSYRYANQYLNFANQYGSYASMFGLDTSAGIQGLDKQDCPFNDGSWKDYFLEAAKNEMLQTKAMLDYAAQNGITLDEEELAEVEAAFDGIDERAKSYGYANADKMMAANYGAGVNVALVRSAMQESTLANKAMEALQESFSYTEQDLEERYQSYAGMRDYFDYSYVTVEAHGDEDSEPTEESKAEAMKTAEAVRAAYAAAKGDDYAQRLSDAAEAQGLSANRGRSTIGSGLVAAGEWMMDAARKAGDVTVEADADGDHVYVVLFISRNDNHYKPPPCATSSSRPRPTRTASTPTRPRRPPRPGPRRSWPSSRPATRARTALPLSPTSTPRTPAPTPTAACTRTSSRARWWRSLTPSASQGTNRATPASSTGRAPATPATT